MAISQNIARKYAKSAFNFAKKLGLLDQFCVDLKKIADNFSESMAEELSNPAIAKADLAKLVANIGEKLSLHPKVISFLEVVARARRIDGIKLIEDNFSKLFKIERKILVAEVFSVAELSADNVQEIKSSLIKKYPDNSIEIVQTIKKDILGGVVVKIDSLMIDASLKTQLLNLNQQFQSVL